MNLKLMQLKVQFKMFKSLKVKEDKNIQAFFALLRAGLWENLLVHGDGLKVNDSSDVDWEKVYQLAGEQTVVGLVLAGIEHSYVKPSQEQLLQWIGDVQMLEQQNLAMNKSIATLVEKMRSDGIYTLLVKGQGIAQCYEKPLWRSCGDIDFFLSRENYEKAIRFLTPLALKVEAENVNYFHLSMTIEPWLVELHSSMRTGLWKRLDWAIDDVQNSVFCERNVWSWMNDKTQVFIPRADEDVVLVFSHILQHFYQEGIGLRQICDWCRLLWTYKDTINLKLLETRIRNMGAMTEWKVFAALAVDWLGMPEEAMPLYSNKNKWSRKAKKVLNFIFETGNFGHNRDFGYYDKYPYLLYKIISLWRHFSDTFKYFKIFPIDAIKVCWSKLKTGTMVTLKEMKAGLALKAIWIL